ncbi:HAMP domain-containing histidine kinase [Glutamicibacter sp. MNS18]|uniref:sensor histidine kinase n=1 Tax=Glutamicibacter sp. MNS18 TaxID=2989817 RepID=UPI002236221F|nr:HAMP domain-containing sensor histidine kinase [Glutamicibacter sp. MNS18]MCW4466765.1 HAMP domain-containing histidine kinase [Glutamicibacter sp. MNS18]
MSLRWKITGMTILSVLLTLVLSALLVRQMITITEEQRLREEATASLEQAARILDETGLSILGAKVNDPRLPAEALEAAQTGHVVTFRSTIDEQEVIYAATPVNLGTQPAVLSLSVSWASSLRMRQSVDTALLWAGITTLVLVSAVAALIASRLVKRLSRGSQAARDIASGERQVVVEDSIGKPFVGADEVDRFAEAVDAMARELNAKIIAEQRFSADLAHELRTPLTGLVTAASLLPDSRPTELVQDRVAKLRSLVEDLLEVSRLESRSESAALVELTLDPCVADILGRIRGRYPERCASLELRPNAGDSTVLVEPRRLERILENLISNAAAHGAGPIRVDTRSGYVSVLDHGPGFPQSILDTGPERFVSKGGGIGLGLTIASGQAQAMGATLELSNQGGALVELGFQTPVPRQDASGSPKAYPGVPDR